MNDFDDRRPRLVSFAAADLQSGDVAQFRSKGWIASAIRWATLGVHSHSGMIRVDEHGRADLLEIREFIGGRASPLYGHILARPGRIDVFRPRADLFGFDRDGAVGVMRLLTSRRYGYRGIARLALQRVPLLWRLTRLETRDLAGDNSAPYCSHAVCHACREGGGVDPVPRKPDDLVTPADLTWSMLFDYHCTLIP